MMGRIDPDCWVTVGVMFWFACFTVVFFNHDIYISRKLWCLGLTVCHFHVQNCYYLTMPRIKTIFHSIAPLSDWCVLFLDVVMNIEVVINSRHLSCWRCTGLTLLSFVRKCADPYLPKCVHVHANHSWSSFIYRRSEHKGFFMNLCKSPFLICASKPVLWLKFTVCSSLHGREGRSQQSSLAFKATWTRMTCWKQLILTGLKGVFLYYHWYIFYQSML